MEYDEPEKFNKLDTKRQNIIAWKLLLKRTFLNVFPLLSGVALFAILITGVKYFELIDYILPAIALLVVIVILISIGLSLHGAKENELKKLKGQINANGSWVVNTTGKKPTFNRINAQLKDGSIKWNIDPNSISESWSLDSLNPVVEYMGK